MLVCCLTTLYSYLYSHCRLSCRGKDGEKAFHHRLRKRLIPKSDDAWMRSVLVMLDHAADLGAADVGDGLGKAAPGPAAGSSFQRHPVPTPYSELVDNKTNGPLSPQVLQAINAAKYGASPAELADVLWSGMVRCRAERRGGRPKPSVSIFTLKQVEMQLLKCWCSFERLGAPPPTRLDL